jgi:hypothetical protein
VPITTKIVNLNPVHGEVYSIQHYVIKLVCQWLATGQWFSPGTPVSSTNKTRRGKKRGRDSETPETKKRLKKVDDDTEFKGTLVRLD